MTHNIGDLVASYADSKLTKIEVGWIAEIVDETIWIAHVEHKSPAYKVQWSSEESASLYMHSGSDIQDMKNLYEEWHTK